MRTILFTIDAGLHQTNAVIVPQLKHTATVPSGDYLAPSMFSGTTTNSYQITRHDRFSLELFQK